MQSLSVQLLSSGADKDSLFPFSLNISWSHPDYTSAYTGGALVEVSAARYLVQVMKDIDDHGDVTEVDVSTVSVLVQGLLPGSDYLVRVSAVNMAGATPSEDRLMSLPPTCKSLSCIARLSQFQGRVCSCSDSIILPPSSLPISPILLPSSLFSSAPKLASMDTQKEADFSLFISWEVAYDGGHPITQFTITIVPQSPRTRRQGEGVVYHVEPSARSLQSQPLQAGRRYLVTLTLENQIGTQEYSLSGKICV